MPCRSTPQQYRALALTHGIAVLGVLAMLAAILLPVYLRPNRLPNRSVITRTAIFRDPQGHLMPQLAVMLQAPSRMPIQTVTDKNGTVTLNDLPLSTNLQIRTLDPLQVVAEVRPTLMAQAVYYAVTVAPPATIRGRLLSATGQPLKGYKPFATVGPDVLHHDRISARWLLTSADGRFQIVGLPPGIYYVTAAQTYLPIAPIQRITVAAGQTKTLTLRVSR